MKKLIFTFFCLTLAFSLTGCTNNSPDNLKRISMDELNEKLDNNESFPLLINSSRCSACIAFKPTINSVLASHDFTLFYVEVDEFTEDEHEMLNQLFNIRGTPSILFIKDGDETSVLNRVVGNVPENELISALRNNGYID